MFAPGAIAWEYSTSSDVSCAQPTICGRLVGSNDGTLPTGRMILKLGGAGRPKPLSNVVSSLWMFWKPKESTMTIVSPEPLSPCVYSGARSYACWNWAGE